MDSKSLTKTGFCNKEIDNVTDNDMKAYILQNLQTKTKINYDTRYAKMYNENYSKNLNNPHLVCLKSLGSPYLLYCTQINDVNYCFLIDKKVKDGYKHPKIFLVHYFHLGSFLKLICRMFVKNWYIIKVYNTVFL